MSEQPGTRKHPAKSETPSVKATGKTHAAKPPRSSAGEQAARKAAGARLRAAEAARIEAADEVVDLVFDAWFAMLAAELGPAALDLRANKVAMRRDIAAWVEQGLGDTDVVGFIETAIAPRIGTRLAPRHAWAYLGGCCRNRAREIEAAARLAAEEEPAVVDAAEEASTVVDGGTVLSFRPRPEVQP